MESNKRRNMEQNYLTEDLITDILRRVSAKNLLRFSCVSKSWCSLIRTDPHLSRLQRTASLNRPCLFIEECIFPVVGSSLYYSYLIDLDSIEYQSINVREIHNPFDHDREYYPRICASCHDLLLLGIDHGNFRKYAVSNPITGKHVVVPKNPAGDDNAVFSGFGYDRKHDCYKLLTRVKRRDPSLELMVYDLDKGTWKRLQFGTAWKSQFQDRYDLYGEFQDRYDLYGEWDHCDGKCVDGAVFWYFGLKVICFLLAEEEFEAVKPPDHRPFTDNYRISMTIFDGKLGFLCGGHEFWSMGMDLDDDGKRQWRWTKLLEISNVPFSVDATFLTPVCFSACKNKILILSRLENRLFWYDIAKKKFNKLTNPINGCSQEGKLFWYDTVKKVHRLTNPIDGRRFSGFKTF